MTRPPIVSGRETVAALERIGYVVVRQKGSHMRLRHPSNSVRAPTTVPDHRELKQGTLRAILRDAGLSVEEFVALISC
jgi:predicted RNA binding protein YcfA (HicA-like mRNA interferase family)